MKTVLYVEDNAVNVLLVETILALRLNVRLFTATLGQLGLELAERDRPDLILLDLHLPDMNGDEFLRKLRAIESVATIPVVIVSADAMHEHQSLLRTLDIAAYVTKPFELAEFDRVIDTYLGPASRAP